MHLQLSLQFRPYMRLKSLTLFKSLTLNIDQILKKPLPRNGQEKKFTLYKTLLGTQQI